MIAETTALSLPLTPSLSPFSCSLLFLWVCYLWPALHKLFSAIMANTIQSVWSFPFNLISRTISRTRHPPTTPLSFSFSLPLIMSVRITVEPCRLVGPLVGGQTWSGGINPVCVALMWLVTQSVVFVSRFTLTLTTEPSTCHVNNLLHFICAARLFFCLFWFCVHLKFSYLSF